MFPSAKSRDVKIDATPATSTVATRGMSSDGRRMMTTGEAAAHLQLSAAYLNKMRVTGAGPVFMKLGRAVRYGQADLDAWVAERRFASTSAAQACGQ